MATMLPPFAQAEVAREVLRCDHCKLVQFRTANPVCRRCKKSVEIEKPRPVAAAIALVASPAEPEHLEDRERQSHADALLA